MSQITQLGSGAIWICKHGNIWWGSQIGKRPSTNFLMRLDKAGLLPSWETYRGWKLVAEQAPNCLEYRFCGFGKSEARLAKTPPRDQPICLNESVPKPKSILQVQLSA